MQVLRDLPPYPSQVDWLGYKLDDYPTISIPHTLTVRLPPAPDGIALSSAEVDGGERNQLHARLSLVKLRFGRRSRAWPHSTCYHKFRHIHLRKSPRPTAFPDPYGADRVAFSHWFTEVNLVGPAYLMRTSLCPFMSHGLKGQSHPLSQSTARQRALKPRRVSFDP